MSNPNPFVPKGSLLEQQSKRRSRLKLAVFCVVAVGVTGLVAMLIQGCKRDTSADLNPLPPDTNNPPAMDTGTNPPIADTNPPVVAAPIVPTTPPPVVTPPVVVTPEPVATAGTEYVVVAGDTLGKIAKKNGVSLKALEAANPSVDSKHLKVKQKLVIPSGGSSTTVAAGTSADATVADAGGETTYTVKSGDTLHRIAKKFGTSIKAIETENNLTTTKIKVGQKLKIPAKAEAAAPAPAAAPTDAAPALPAPPVSTAPAAAPAPAPAAPTSN